MSPAKIADAKSTPTKIDALTAGGGLSNKKTVLYHVCNDYSLAPMEQGDPLPTERDYEEFPHELGTALYHREYGELHYLRAPEGLEGKYA